ncbi:RNA polymerase sigma factor [Actinomadura fibrosa]|uniref:RNA polymerase sigma factor n=1 Tax=Actinomadura fibrosa TaxID=111802 RepID=A0ABW2X9B6_9ACTN|nr:sigma-70 family RNA polymerase sigma factor [Actinomadura fibrosa]
MAAVTRRPGPTSTGRTSTNGALAAGDDSGVIQRSRHEPECFAVLFDRYYTAIHGYAARRLGPALADDVAAETFLIAFDRRGSYDAARGDARPWLYGIASNLIARHRRAEVRQYRALARTGADAIAESHADRVAGRLDAQAARGPLAAALSDLPDADRDVLLLVAWGQLGVHEVGEALGIPVGTARSRLHRARRRVRAALGDSAPTTLGEDLDG